MSEELQHNTDPFATDDDVQQPGQTPQPTATDTTTDVVSVPAKKVFTLKDIRRNLTVAVHMPNLYPGFDPWEFDLRLKLSDEAEQRRQEYLSLSASEMTVKLQDQALDEICDLLVAPPRGFGDLPQGQAPGASFKAYVESAHPEDRTLLYQIVEGADNLYWTSISPREFRRSI